MLHDGDYVRVGALSFRVLHTPGHSPEHVCYVVSGGGKGAENDWAVFTGDALFAGEVGRPDLSVGRSPEELARSLYSSLQGKLLELEGGVEVYPAHGEGSPCGGSIGVRDRTTIGYESRYNEKLKADSKAAFVERVLEESFVIDGRQLRGVGSLGTVSYPEQGLTIDELLRHADAAMYREEASRRRANQADTNGLEERLLA